MEHQITLGKTGKQFKRKVVKIYVFKEPQDLKRLDMAAQCLDRLDLCATEIEENGPFFTTKTGQKRENPALKTERELKTLFCRIVRDLKLDDEETPETKPNLNKRGSAWLKSIK
jgi:hypothetical protein